jgi:putative ABC transport system substrate-binding protein
VRRRLLLSTLAALPTVPARAQAPRRPVIGVLMARDEHFNAALLRAGLQERGWAESSYSLLTRSSGGPIERLPALAAELVAANVDVILAILTPAALAAKRATQTIPIVISAGDPVSWCAPAAISRASMAPPPRSAPSGSSSCARSCRR